MGRTKKAIKVGKISEKDEILTLEEKRISLIENKTKRIIEMSSYKRELDSRRAMASSMWINKLIEKERELLADIGGKIC